MTGKGLEAACDTALEQIEKKQCLVKVRRKKF